MVFYTDDVKLISCWNRAKRIIMQLQSQEKRDQILRQFNGKGNLDLTGKCIGITGKCIGITINLFHFVCDFFYFIFFWMIFKRIINNSIIVLLVVIINCHEDWYIAVVPKMEIIRSQKLITMKLSTIGKMQSSIRSWENKQVHIMIRVSKYDYLIRTSMCVT